MLNVILFSIALAIVVGWFLYKRAKERNSKDMDIKPIASNEDNDPGLMVFKSHLEDKLDEVRASLITIDTMQPLFIYSSGGRIQEIPLTMRHCPAFDKSSEDICLQCSEKNCKWEDEKMQMRDVCSSPRVEYAALLFNSYLYTGPAEKVQDIQKRGMDLQDVGGTVDVVMLFLYARRGMIRLRRIEYEKRDVEDYWFSDSGYQDKVDPGEYKSPFPEQ
jgi:hypothetical protein